MFDWKAKDSGESSGIFYALDRIGSCGCVSGIVHLNVQLLSVKYSVLIVDVQQVGNC